MTTEFKYQAGFFAVIIVITAIAGAFPAASPMRAVLLPLAAWSFIIGLIYWQVRAGWKRDRQNPYSTRGLVSRVAIGITLAATAASVRMLTPLQGLPALFFGILGMIGIATVLLAIGGLLSARTRNT